MLSDNIKAARIASNFSKADMARKLGIPYTTYNSYERNEAEPNYKTLQKIASALEIDVTELLQPLKVTEIDLGDGLKQRKEIHGEPGNKLTPEKEEAINKGLLLDSFDKLNDKGQQKAVAYVELLAGHPDYNKDKNA